jgi:hypothetical protein
LALLRLLQPVDVAAQAPERSHLVDLAQGKALTTVNVTRMICDTRGLFTTILAFANTAPQTNGRTTEQED